MVLGRAAVCGATEIIARPDLLLCSARLGISLARGTRAATTSKPAAAPKPSCVRVEELCAGKNEPKVRCKAKQKEGP